MEFLDYTIDTVADFASMKELLQKRLRWLVVTRHMRPAGHLGLLLTQGIFWCVVAAAVAHSMKVAAALFLIYLTLRVVLTMIIGSHGLKQPSVLKRSVLIPLWDAIAFLLWITSFMRRSVMWRGSEYYIREGQLVPVAGAKE